jgi:hypothetical protein
VAAAASKLREIYTRKGIKPAKVTEDIRQEPTLAQDLLSEDAVGCELLIKRPPGSETGRGNIVADVIGNGHFLVARSYV